MKVKVHELPGWQAELKVTPQGDTTPTFFQNWVENDTPIYRASQPNYPGDDSVQIFTRNIIKWLKREKKVDVVVSLNHCPLAADSARWFVSEDIDFIHVVTPDFTAPNKYDVHDACKKVYKAAQNNRKCLIYCGYGQGRTGTMVTACEIYTAIKKGESWKTEELIKASTAEEDNQEAMLRMLAQLITPKEPDTQPSQS
ncbi:hypothetical protein V7V80_02210 [Pseudomonas kermanshahensis]|uniref:Tyrosine specific protein phosphatases domain-containing protein n=1 Tax=Pseudomonas kermanshahensis TaxID=2745482 RepID=A0ABU8R0V0_9PSED